MAGVWGKGPPKVGDGRRLSHEPKSSHELLGADCPAGHGGCSFPPVKGVVVEHGERWGAYRASDSFVPNPRDKRRWDDGWCKDHSRMNELNPLGERVYFTPIVKKTQARVRDAEVGDAAEKKIKKILRSMSVPAAALDYEAEMREREMRLLEPEEEAEKGEEPSALPVPTVSVDPGASSAEASTRKSPKRRDPRRPRPPGQVPVHKGYKVRPPPNVRWFSVVDGPREMPQWQERWWLSQSRQQVGKGTKGMPVGQRDYFDRPRRAPFEIPAWPEPSKDRWVKANWRNDDLNWGERERERLNKPPPKPEPVFDVSSDSVHNDAMIDGMRTYFIRYQPLYMKPEMLMMPRKKDERGSILAGMPRR